MLGLAGIPATAGFVGKFYLIDAAVSGGYTWLGVAIAVGSMISLGYYLPVVAAMWMREAPGDAASRSVETGARPDTGHPLPTIAGGSPELDPPVSPIAGAQWEVVLVAVLAGAATIALGIVPQPLFELVRGVGGGLGLF
jgi:NADH-quinone oxidoreductase subunit N